MALIMWIIFIILGVVLVWGLCKSGSRFSEPRAENEETWEEPSGQPGKNSDDELEKIRRQVWEDHKRQEELRQKQLEKERMAPILEKQAALARQKELEDKYANSPLTREIIQTIRGEKGKRFLRQNGHAAHFGVPGEEYKKSPVYRDHR